MSPPDPWVFNPSSDNKDIRLGDIVEKDISWEGDFPDNTVALIGFPLDKGIERIGGRIGASRGPTELRKKCYRLTTGCRYPLNDLTLLDLGDLIAQKDLETSHERMGDIVAFWIKKGVFPIVLGGSHDLSFGSNSGLIQAIPRQEKIGLINIDSHLDLRSPDRGINSGTAFYRLLERWPDQLPGTNLIEFAVQEQCNSSFHYEYAVEKGVKLYFLDELRTEMDGPVGFFPQTLRMVGKDVASAAISIDIDVCARVYAPGASAPQADGLTASEILKISFLAGKERKIKLLDICEVSPPLDIAGMTVGLAAQIIYCFLQGITLR
jgi:formimidoylglutamase